jgi:hypothetical protein
VIINFSKIFHFKYNIKTYCFEDTKISFLLLFMLIIPFSLSSQDNKDSINQTSSQLEDILNYNAKDSIILNVMLKKAYLYNDAHVDYGEIKLDACYIEFDFQSKEVIARHCLDSLGNKIGIPILSDGSTETKSDSLKFNFETKRGITYQVKLQEGESFIHGDKVKRQSNGDIHINSALYTTCDLDEPHYYFKLRKAIIIPNDKIISGPVNLIIAEIPTPLGLPFAFLPNKKDNSANGIVIPIYGESSALGFYLTGGGYYHKFKNNKLSTLLTGDIYSKGSWGILNNTIYKNRYKYNGNIQLNFRQIMQGERGFEDFGKTTDFFIRWTHNQDRKAHPTRTFKANINAGTTTNFKNDYNNISASNYLANTFNSNIAFSKQYKGKINSNLNVNLRHNQNNTSELITFTLPEATYNINRFYPLKMLRKKTSFKDNFFNTLINQTNVSYNANFKNEVSDTAKYISLNNINSLIDKSRYGMRHNINASSSIKLLKKNITINPSYKYSSLWYMESINKNWNNLNNEIITDTIREFIMGDNHSFSASATTKIYGFYKFAKFLSGKSDAKVRHTITPNINFSYRPDKGYSYDYQTDSIGTISTYSPFANGIYGTPYSGESGRLGVSLINALELKRNNHKDTTGKKPFIKSKILDNITFSSGYDFIRDSLKMDIISINGRTKLWKTVSLRFAGAIDPYWTDDEGNRRNIYQYDVNKKIGTLSNANLAISFNLKSKKNKTKEYKSERGSQEELDMINSNPDAYIDFNIPWTLNFDYKIDVRRSITSTLDTMYLTQSVGLRGDISVTKNWKLSYITNYDFTKKEFSYTSIGVARDLHCWELGFNWIPFGYMQSYNIQINVKSSLLQDLRLQRRRTWYDNGVR